MTQNSIPTPNYERYEAPEEIISDDRLNRDSKLSLLEKWAEDEKALIRANAEGLQGGETPRLKSVQEALSKLKNMS